MEAQWNHAPDVRKARDDKYYQSGAFVEYYGAQVGMLNWADAAKRKPRAKAGGPPRDGLRAAGVGGRGCRSACLIRACIGS